MTLWMFVDIAMALFFAVVTFVTHRQKRPMAKWTAVAAMAWFTGLAVYQWFRSHPGSWPF